MVQPAFWLSVVVPCWRDEAGALRLLKAFAATGGVEWIVAHTETGTEFRRELETHGACAVETGAASRGAQLRAGAAAAHGGILLFHHADSFLTPAHLDALRTLAEDPGWVWGAFYRKFDERHPRLRRFEGIERWHNRTFGAVYGDQSLFIRRQAYHDHGGFAPIPLMEDVEFSLRLRRTSPPRMTDPPMASSPRKHLARGPWRTTLGNLAALCAFHLGAPPGRLHAWYYKKTGRPGNIAAPQPSLLNS